MRGSPSLPSALQPGTPLLIKFIVRYGFVEHGFAGLLRSPQTFAVVLHTLGVPMPMLVAWATTLVELIGLLVPIISIAMAVALMTAPHTVYLHYSRFSVKLVEVTKNETKCGPTTYEIRLYLRGLGTLAMVFSVAILLQARRIYRHFRSN